MKRKAQREASKVVPYGIETSNIYPHFAVTFAVFSLRTISIIILQACSDAKAFEG